LVHEYFRIDEEILWRASQDEIPPLIVLLEEIIKQNSAQKKVIKDPHLRVFYYFAAKSSSMP